MRTVRLKENEISLSSVLITSFMVLLLGHGAYTTLIPNIVLNVLAMLAIILLLIIIKLPGFENKLLFIVLIIYICSHFDFLNKYGGLFPLISFLIGIYYLISKKKLNPYEFNDRNLEILIFILLISNLFGWIFKSDASIFWKSLGIASFLGYLFIYYVSQKQLLTINAISLFVRIIVIIQFYELLVAINTYLGLVKTGTNAFFPTSSRFGSYFTEGTLNHSELFGELAVISSLFLIPFLFAPAKSYSMKKGFIMFGIACSVINVLLSGSRSSFILLPIGFILFYLVSSLKFGNIIKFNKSIKYLFLIVILLVGLWGPLNFGFVIQRITNPKTGINLGGDKNINIITGKGTPREMAFSYFFRRYKGESWWIGYGWGTQEVNHKAWFGDRSIIRADYHSLYLSIIIIYGWIGSIAYVLLFLYTLFKLIRSLNYSYKYKNPFFYPILGFIFLLSFLLIDEYKTSLMRISSYHMLTWIWLGLANSLVNSFKLTFRNEGMLVSPLPGGVITS